MRPAGPRHHHQVLSSLPSILRKCSREQVSQNRLVRPDSTDVVQVNGGVSLSGVAPQRSQCTAMSPVYRLATR